MGPLTLADFIGLDTCLAIMNVLYEGFKDSKYRPCPLLVKMVEAGYLGKKQDAVFTITPERSSHGIPTAADRKKDAVAVLTINRPKALNSLNSAVLDELLTAFTELGQDQSIKAVVLTGSGEKAFIAGADIAEMAEMTAQQAQAFSRKGQQLVNLMGRLAKPVIAAVNGFALGGGLGNGPCLRLCLCVGKRQIRPA